MPLDRGSNRTVNTALHMIAITWARGVGRGKEYLDKLAGTGKTRTEALRLLHRRLSDAVSLHCASTMRTIIRVESPQRDALERPSPQPA
jgi:hypothetical protein